MLSHRRPAVFCFSGHDPSGGAGLQADIETLVSHHCHAVGVITTLTEQDTHNVKKLIPQMPEDIIRQAECVLQDIAVTCFKIGLMGHVNTVRALDSLLTQWPTQPVILDPILAAGGGAVLSNNELIQLIIALLLPKTTVLTPNSQEARQLTGLTDLTACGLKLLDLGCRYVLITGAHEDTATVNNQLFYDGKLQETYSWDRLPHSYHGSGCTLAASVAGLIAHGLEPQQAIFEAQEYTWNSLNNAFQTGTGQYNPNRLFWLHETS